ncbi:MAG: pentapeptide repeat-containing protein [Actinophytocola sp.]|nr:pentapeptide repeat-containing protein [Actinophytocola sp.]
MDEATRTAARRSHALSTRTIVIWSVTLGVIAVVAAALLWLLLGTGRPEDALRLDALRTAAGIVIGAGGAAALLLAARRQRYVELDLEQKDHDATERRVTELYGKAADQLGDEKAPVRLAGIYGLERLAQDHPEHRRTIVNLLCAYLRMPYRPPEEGTDDDEARQEREVRAAVQTVLFTHLQPADPANFWPDTDLNLSDATLERFTLRRCRVRSAVFRRTVFHKDAGFFHTEFTQRSDFRDAVFLGIAEFRNASFAPEGRNFQYTTFEGKVTFGERGGDSGRGDDTTGVALTEARLNLKNAVARADTTKRTWPSGWTDEPHPDRPGWVRLVQTQQSPK